MRGDRPFVVFGGAEATGRRGSRGSVAGLSGPLGAAASWFRVARCVVAVGRHQERGMRMNQDWADEADRSRSAEGSAIRVDGGCGR